MPSTNNSPSTTANWSMLQWFTIRCTSRIDEVDIHALCAKVTARLAGDCRPWRQTLCTIQMRFQDKESALLPRIRQSRTLTSWCIAPKRWVAR